jgi:putative oxidoreductase
VSTVLWIAQILVGLAFILAGVAHAALPVTSMAPRMPWTGAIPLQLLRFIGVVEVLGGLGVILGQLAGLNALVSWSAAGLVLIMLLAAVFHATRREYPNIGGNVALGALAAFVAYGRALLVPM